MGNFQSNTMQSLSSEVVNAITDVMNNVNINSTSNCTNVQNIDINTCPTFVVYGNLDVTETATTQCVLTATDFNSTNENISNILSQAVANVASQNSQAYQDFLSTAFSDQTNSVEFISQLTQQINTNITNDVVNNCINSVSGSQNIELNLCGTIYGDVNANTNAQLLAVTNCVFNNLGSMTINNQSLQNIANTADQALLTKQSGFFSFLDKFWKIILGVIILLFILLIIGIAFYYFFLRPKGQKPPTIPGYSPYYPGAQSTVPTLPSSAPYYPGAQSTVPSLPSASQTIPSTRPVQIAPTAPVSIPAPVSTISATPVTVPAK